MELRHLSAFVAVAEEESFTRAAQRLHMVQSAVSAAVRTLERELDVTLFDRTTHQVRLSDAGELLLPEARNTLYAASTAHEVIDELHGGLRGTIRLGVMAHNPAFGVARLIAEFRNEHPHVEFALHRGDSTSHTADLRRDRLDIALLAMGSRMGAGLLGTELIRQQMVLICPAGHPLAGGRSVGLDDLSEEPFAEAPPSWGTRISNDQAFAAAGVERRIDYEVADVTTVIDFVRHGLAVSIVPATVVGDDARISRIPIRRHAPVLTTSVAIPAHRGPSASVRALLRTARRLADAEADSGSEPL
jgi:DNA-binding transcriptional LysR family regulator